MPGCGQQTYTGQNLRFATDDLVGGTRKVNQTRQRVVRLMRSLELCLLYEDGSSGKVHIPTAVVEVKMAVHDPENVIRSNAQLC
jgi:hypothetical protein